MLRRYLFVGLGGSGGKTLRFLKDEIRRWMREQGLPGDVPLGWQFLHIDTPPTPDGDEINDLVPQLGPEEYLGLTPPGVELSGLLAKLKAGDDRFLKELAAWLPDPEAVDVPLHTGAGQFRAVGHSVGLAFAGTILQRLTQSLDKLNRPEAQIELNNIELHADHHAAPPAGASPEPLVIVISSLAGGTGAGLLLTVCDLLRAEPMVGRGKLMTILYTSEVFRALADAQTRGVDANSLAALCEILNGNWSRDLIEDPFMKDAGSAKPIIGSGPPFPFLVGARNSAKIAFGRPEELFESMGRALLSWITDEKVAAHLVAVVIANSGGAGSRHPMGPLLVNEGPPREKGYPSFSALGFARLSLGTAHFERYSVRRIATDALVHLAKNHYLGPEAADKRHSDKIVDPEEIADAIAIDLGDWFRKSAQIVEPGDQPGNIRTALTLPQHEEDGLVNDCQVAVHRLAEIDAPNIVRSEQEWADGIGRALAQSFPECEHKYEKALQEQAAEWISGIQERIRVAAEEAIAAYGLRVVERLCLHAAAYLRDVGTELRENIAPGLRDAAAQWQQHTQAGVSLGGKKKRPSTHPKLKEYVRQALWFRRWALKAMVAEEAAALAPCLADGVFEPLAAELKRAAVLLADEARGEQAVVPGEFNSPTGEFTLIEVDEFEQWFDRLLDKGDGEDGQVRVRMEASKQLLEILLDWSPDREWIMDPPRTLAVTSKVSRKNLESRAAEILNEEGTPFGEFLTLGLRDALDNPGAHHVEIGPEDLLNFRKSFTGKLARVIEAAQPLIDIDNQLAGHVHPGGFQDAIPQITSLPFEEHPMKEPVRAILEAGGIEPDDVEKLFNADERARRIDVTSVLEAPQSMLVMASLLDPIASSWTSAATHGGQVAEWWLHRRARTLQRFVPCPQAHLRCMIRGWFTGRALGLIQIEDDSGAIWIARPGLDDAYFPNPTLSKPRNSFDRVAVVLEALAVAYVEVARTSRLDPLEPYRRLLELGRQRDGDELAKYGEPNRVLSDWIDRGQRSTEARLGMFQPLRASLGDNPSPQDRRKALMDVLGQSHDQFAKEYALLAAEWRRDSDLLARTPLWTGLWPIIGEELEKMHIAIGRHGPDTEVLA